jgi:hypothetical protein
MVLIPSMSKANGSAFTLGASGGQIDNGDTGACHYTLIWNNGPGTAYMRVSYKLKGTPNITRYHYWEEDCPTEQSHGERRDFTIPVAEGEEVIEMNTPSARTTPWPDDPDPP